VEAYDLAFEALGDRTRRQTFELLRGGPRSVGALAEQLPVSRPAVSQHLRVLKDAGLVRDEQAGNRRLYSVNPGSLETMRAYFDEVWTDALARFKERAES
jgi:DNA-binding transcriptional ArsR family regulator